AGRTWRNIQCAGFTQTQQYLDVGRLRHESHQRPNRHDGRDYLQLSRGGFESATIIRGHRRGALLTPAGEFKRHWRSLAGCTIAASVGTIGLNAYTSGAFFA